MCVPPMFQEFIIQETEVKKQKKIESDSEENKHLYNFAILSLCSSTARCGPEVHLYLQPVKGLSLIIGLTY